MTYTRTIITSKDGREYAIQEGALEIEVQVWSTGPCPRLVHAVPYGLDRPGFQPTTKPSQREAWDQCRAYAISKAAET